MTGFVNLLGAPAMFRDMILSSSGGTAQFGTNALMDATAEKIAFLGNLWHPTIKTGTINIRKILFRAGAVTLNANSEVRVSLQDVSLTAGPPAQPDGVQDQFYDFKTATQTLTSNTWFSTGDLSADRAVDLAVYGSGVANSRRFAVVWEFQAFNASDSVIINSFNTEPDFSAQANTVLNTGSWANLLARSPNVAFELDDGSLAFFHASGAWSAFQSPGASIASNGAIRRAGVIFSVPATCKLERVGLTIRLPNGADGSMILYDTDGTTALRTIPLDNDADVTSVGAEYYNEVPIEPVIILANQQYRLAFVASTTTAAQLTYGDTASVALMDFAALGRNAYWTQHDGSVWAETTTRRPGFSLGFGAVDTGLAANPLRGFIG